MNDHLRLIAVDDDPELLSMLKAYFLATGQACETFLRAETALEHLAKVPCDIMLTDIIMPGMGGLELAERAKRLRPAMNIIVTTGHIDKFSYDDAVAAGASDFIRKPFSLKELEMRIQHVQLQEKLRIMSITDDLTGLPNRRGFFVLAEQQLKAALRGKRDLTLFFIDMDNFKTINDTWGHQEGDRALTALTAIFRQSFRASDVIGRMGGDEFAILLIDSPRQNIDVILERLMQNIARFNDQNKAGYRIAVSIGMAVHDPEQRRSIDDMLRDADQLMYHQKLKKKSGNPEA